MWQPDGWGQTRIGILTPHADIVPEIEFSALAPNGVSIHAAHIPFGGYKPGGVMDPTIASDPVRAIADPPSVDDAAEMLAMAPLHAIVFGIASSSFVRGVADDAALKSRLEARTRGHTGRSPLCGGFYRADCARRETDRASKSTVVL
ncbi:hypothetical protein [Bradyrhizobium murdochi]|uniref:hypothetical protein n=1 Tax=Bradyrhizobium murdochi TaxID=1038859 RepID=UPI0018DE0DC3|nr:hypothetical protein [Bradyrhizobium murdochi]